MRERRNVGERWWKEEQRVRGWQKKRLLRRAWKKLRAIANRPSRCAFSANRVFDTRRRDHSRISWHPIVFRIVQITKLPSVLFFISRLPFLTTIGTIEICDKLPRLFAIIEARTLIRISRDKCNRFHRFCIRRILKGTDFLRDRPSCRAQITRAN